MPSDLHVGFVYVLTNESLPHLVKIGTTRNLPEDRSKQLQTTGVPTPFDIAFRAATSHPLAAEQKAHELLAAYRVNPKREFFKVSVERAVEAVRFALIEEAGILSWVRNERYMLTRGNRLALTLEAGQTFVLTGYESMGHVLAGAAKILDLWQAHSNGDQLEIYVTGSPGHVAGFSEGDPGGTDDPVPFLDRAGTAANGLINGRERLLPGERLLWLPSTESAETASGVVFEARDYCQVVSRTWSPATGAHGLPLLLNDFQQETMRPSTARIIHDVLALPIPREWAPRDDRGPSWSPSAQPSPPPEFWLPQLKPPSRRR